MTVLVHRPTRATVAPSQPEPETLAAPPPLVTEAGGFPLQFLLPMVGAMSSVVVMVVMRNGQPLFLLIAGVVFVLAVVAGLGFAISSHGRKAAEQAEQRRRYLDYLETLRRDLQQRSDAARDEASGLHPEPDALASLVRDPARLWERRRRDDDFLRVRVGTGAVPWFRLTVPPAESPVQPHDPYLLAEATAVAERFATVPAMPVTIDLRQAHEVAVIGDRDSAVALVRALVLQLAAVHAPDDLQLALASASPRVADWAGFDLLPHAQDPELFDGPVPARRIAESLAGLGQVLGQGLTDRLQVAHSTRRGGPAAAPARLVVIADEHGERAGGLPGTGAGYAELGVTVVHLLSDRLHEPTEVDLRITLTDATASIETRPGTPAASTVTSTPDGLDAPGFSGIARSLAALRLSELAGRPDEGETAMDLAALLGVARPRDIDVQQLWQPRSPADFLRVPFGVDDHGNRVYLDLKESAQFGMGPHGICIGATGSGKSEMLRTLILSLAMAHPPEDLSMILVDYKGGAAFAPFAGLPHLAGLIDNLADDPQLTARARASVQGEVVRRQQLLKDAGSSPSITHYRQLREQQPDLPPLPHLFVVIDEFGELLTAEPDFIDLFLQIGRIGRSIGVHLLLSSQRIEGGKLRGLDTYLSYRLGLRTFSEAESAVVLNTPDAFHLPALPGYGYLKVDTSVYTRFRAGFVSGPAQQVERVRVTSTAPRPLLLPAYNGIRTERDAPEQPLELRRPETGVTFVEASVATLRDEDRLTRPVWLPPLPDRVALGSLISAATGLPPLTPVVGLVDDPAKQAQAPLTIDLTRNGGHLVIVGAPQSGRSTLLRTLAVSLCLTRTPREVAIYGLDATGGGLQRIEDFPHVGGVATRGNRDRLRRLLEELAVMLVQREAVFKDRGIDSLAQLRSLHAQGKLTELPAADIVLLVDGYGALRSDFDELEDLFTDIMQRASSYGIHLVLTMTRLNELRLAHQALFGNRIELRLNDAGDSSIDRKLSAVLPAGTPGRALLADKTLAQVALPVLDEVPDEEVADELQRLAAQAARSWSGPAAAPIRLLPLQLSPEELPDRFDEPDAVPFGLRQDTMEPALWDFSGEDQHLVVFGDTKCGKTSLLRTLAAGMIDRFTPDELAIAVIDIRGHVPSVIADDYLAAHARNAQQARALATSIAAELVQRPERSPEEQAKSPRIVVLVDDYDIVSAGGTDPLGPLLPHLPSARDLGLHLIITRPVAGASRAMYDRVLQVTRDTGGSLLLMSGERSEGQLVPRVYPERFPPGRGRFIRRGERPHIVQVALPPS
ncbi:type VII secretion protein EccCa [Micropruina sp.]|uniref:type VII secretion protein EccCa n=1 Tax=Micropruina sp. TaxID=2737536 RepID=UPI0039E538E4